jgi:hypothetical protein
LIFHFIIPVVKTTRQVKNQFRDMHNRMQGNMNQDPDTNSSNNSRTPDSKNSTSKGQAADYIDFEEVK